MDLPMELAKKFHELFHGLERAHGLWQNGDKTHTNKVKGKAKTVQQPVTDELWRRHLSGEIGIGIIPINDEDTCVWGAIDIDIYDGLDHAALEQEIAEAELPLVVFRSKSGGAHLYLFTSEPVKARLLQLRLKECAVRLGQPTAEVFPKQTVLDGENGIGNWINMPYQAAVYTTRYALRGGVALSAEQMLDYAEDRKITAQQLQDLKPKALATNEWADAPPCLEKLVAEGFPEGSRNNALFCLAVYAKKRWPEGDWQNKVVEYNQRWMSGGYQEVSNIIKSLSRSVEYKYKCKDQPLCNNCNQDACLDRTYGISNGERKKGPGRPRKNEDVPCVLEEVDKPVKVFRPPVGSGDEPQWLFTIAGKKMDVTLDMLMDQKRFLREFTRTFERLRLMVPEPKWQDAVNELLSEAEGLDLPPDAGPEGQLMQHLEGFCNGKTAAYDVTELTMGRPWTEEETGMVWFRSKDLVAYLDRVHFKEFKQRELYPIFRKNGAIDKHFMIKGACVSAWGIPAFPKQTEELDAIALPVEGGSGDSGEKGVPF